MLLLHASHTVTSTPVPPPAADAVLIEGLLGLMVSAVAAAVVALSWWLL